MAKEHKDSKIKKSNLKTDKIEKRGDDIMENNEKEVLNDVKEDKKETVVLENSVCNEEPVVDEPKMVIVNPSPCLKEEKFSDKLANGIEGAAKVTVKAVVTGYNKAEAYVKSEEFKQGVEKTKNTTKAVAVGIFRGLKKLGQEVSTAVKEVKNREEPIVDPNQDKTKDI